MSSNASRPMNGMEHHSNSDEPAEDRSWRTSSRSARPRRDKPSVRLTPRELEVLALLCQGLSNKLISRRLNISSGTVKTHVGNVLRALGASSRLHAVVMARQWALVSDAPAQDDGELRGSAARAQS